MKPVITIAALVTISVLLGATAWWLLPESATLGRLENIHGIPFPTEQGSVVVTEKLAHADIYLMRPPIARAATLTLTYTPLNERELAVGIRENSFWLSYPKNTVHPASTPVTAAPASHQQRTHTLAIPLTDKLPDRDGSLDMMFFAPGTTNDPDEGAAAATRWQLHEVRVTTYPALPTLAQLKDALHRLVTREQVQ